MRRPARRIRHLAVLAMALLAGNAGASDLFLFRGEFIYIIPRALSDEMTRLAGRGEWKQFPQHTRFLDLDTDGADDFVAVAFGATSGHGAQVRYRLRHTPGGGVRLGRWYWGVLVNPDGRKLFERFNP